MAMITMTATIPRAINMELTPIILPTSTIGLRAICDTLKDFTFEMKIGRQAASLLGCGKKSPQQKDRSKAASLILPAITVFG